MKCHLSKILALCASFVLLSCGISKSVRHEPIFDTHRSLPEVTKVSDTLWFSGENFFIKNKQGLWELSIRGDAQQLGLLNGALTQDLLRHQEAVFFSKVEEIVPSKTKQFFLRQFLKWYNRKLYLHVPEEYKTEIYGLSQYASEDFNHIAPKYLRQLYLHAAHDIGHALQDLALVGCSSLAVWDDNSEDGELLIGRNFDFYAGDDFAKNKVVAFVRPENGYAFVSVTWPGMIGVVSGMNTAGLTVTMNAGKSDMPLKAKTPVSILARKILQYAQNTEEAIAIAQNTEVFVSESIMIGSGSEKTAILLEISPEKFDVFRVENQTHLVCSNHFQSEAYLDDEKNLQHIVESHSQYRFDRLIEHLDEKQRLNHLSMAEILRDVHGLHGSDIGYGNEKALNQLLGHHAVIFKPESLTMWVSTAPYQLGEFVCYDLNEIFNSGIDGIRTLGKDSKNIPEDTFMYSEDFKKYELYRDLNRQVDKALGNKKLTLTQDFIESYQSSNLELWVVYYKIGKYYMDRGFDRAAKREFEKALSKEITTLSDRVQIEKYLKKISQ